MGPLDAGLAAGAGLLAGAVNTIAGGGTLIAFPALLATGMPALTANITCSVGLVTGYAGGAFGYRRELSGQAARLRALAVPALSGGLTGAVILLVTPADSFRAVVGYLIGVSCLLLAAQPRLAGLVATRRAAAAPRAVTATASGAPPEGSGATASDLAPARSGPSATASGPAGAPEPRKQVTWPTRIGVFLAGAYGSYFGAGLGVLLLGTLGILLPDDIQRTNAAKALLSFGINATGIAVFVVGAHISWAFAAILLVTSYTGGLFGARVARVLPATALRGAVVVIGAVVAAILITTR